VKIMKMVSTIIFILILPTVSLASSAVFGFGPQHSAFYNYSYSTAAFGRGGVETAVLDTIGINYHNYALWSYYGRTMLSMDMTYENMTIKQPGKSYDAGDAKFAGGFLSFPIIKRRINLGIGLKPMIINDQRFDRTFSANDISGRERVTTTGNISETTFALAWNIHNRLAFALVGRYTFGLIKDNITILYDRSDLGDIYAQNKYRISGLGMRLDGHYMVSSRLHSGFSIGLPLKADLEVSQDAPSSPLEEPEMHSLQFPLHLAVGLSYALSTSWLSCVDLNYAKWKDGYKIDNIVVADMNNSIRLGVGIEKRPVYSKKEKITYRAGFFSERINMYANGIINEYGGSLGFGIPLRMQYNRIDFALQVGRRGKMKYNLAEETYFQFNISLSASEFWFTRDER
jgi:hypothetical protein